MCLPHSISTLSNEAESLAQTKSIDVVNSLYLCPPPTGLELQERVGTPTAFTLVLGVQMSVLILIWQAFYPWCHLPILWYEGFLIIS